jgi:hypothetical protein
VRIQGILPQEALDDVRISVYAEALLEGLFGKEIAEKFDRLKTRWIKMEVNASNRA